MLPSQSTLSISQCGSFTLPQFSADSLLECQSRSPHHFCINPFMKASSVDRNVHSEIFSLLKTFTSAKGGVFAEALRGLSLIHI